MLLQIVNMSLDCFLRRTSADNILWASVMSVCMSVRIIKLDSRWTDLDEIWHGLYSIEIYPKNGTFQFPAIGNGNMADERNCGVG